MKPIKMTAEVVETMVNEFREALAKMKIADGNVTYKRSLIVTSQHEKVDVVFTPSAYAKMLALVMNFDTEVAWHGTVEREGDNTFVITDILVYPQTVTGVTVETDQEGYTKWLIGLSDEQANHLHMQGHSHVNMSTSPSATDLTHQETILQQLNNEDFYIFIIWNKGMQHTIKVYDLKSNLLYEDKDINVSVLGDDVDLDAFIKDAEDKVEERRFERSYPTYGNYPYAHDKTPSVKKAGKKSKKADEDILQGQIDDFDAYIYGATHYPL